MCSWLKWWGSGGLEMSRDPETGKRETGPSYWEQLFLISVAVPLSCKKCLECQQNPSYWYIHQSCPHNPRSCHSTVQWPIYLFFLQSGIFLPTLVLGPVSITSQVSMFSLLRMIICSPLLEDEPINHPVRSPLQASPRFLKAFVVSTSLFSPSLPTGHRRISGVRPPVWRWSSGRSRSADGCGAASASGSLVRVCGGSAGSPPVWRRRWCCSGRGAHLPASDSLSLWSAHLVRGEGKREGKT